MPTRTTERGSQARPARSALLIGAAALAALAATTGARNPASAPVAAAGQPNILLILADDLDRAEIAQMPILRQQVITKGLTFSNAFVSTPICCPSRATILRGQYAHNTGIKRNTVPEGGFPTAYASGLEHSTVATWLDDAGYATALIGKYLNGYPRTATQTYVPPGWDEWYSAVMGDPYSEYDYTLNENGTLVSYGHAPADYGTTVYTGKAQDVMTRAARAGQPFFVWLSVYAPHAPSTPAPEDVNLFPGAIAPRTPNYNEADVSDKPLWLQALPLMKAPKQAEVDAIYRERIRSLQAVDRAVAALIGTLAGNGQLANTYVVFTSDNGFHLGPHRMPHGKDTAYDEDIHVPLHVRGPGVPANRKRPHLVGNIDLAPTFAALAGAAAPAFVDGRSLAPLLTGTPPGTAAWRHNYLLGHWVPTPGAAPAAGHDEPPDRDDLDFEVLAVTKPELHGVRTPRYTYVELATGEKELYDHAVDPYELNNIATSAPAALLRRLHQKLVGLQACSGADCRVADR